MRSIPFRRLTLVSLAALAALLAPAVVPSATDFGRALAQEADQAARPLVIVNVAGVDRVLKDLDYMFESAGRPELSDMIANLLAGIGDLQGLDREKPFGVMLFLTPGFPPQIEPVSFIPARNLDDLMRTLSIGPVSARKLDGEGRYELLIPRQTLQVRLQGDFALLARTDDVLDRKLPDPATLTRQLTNRYDLSLAIRLDAVPETMKSFVLDFLRAQTEAELQQRDNEPDAAYRLRRSRGMSNLEVVELLLTQGEDLTIGLDASAEHKRIVVEAAINAAEDSEFARSLKEIGGRQSRFGSLLDDPSPLTVSASWNLDDRGKKNFSEGLKVAEQELTARLAALDPEGRAVKELFSSLTATAEEGHVDFFTRFQGDAPGRFVLVGGLRVLKARSLADGLSDLLTRLRDRPELDALELNVDQHNGIAFHRVVGRDVRREDERLYGGRPALYVGAGSNTLWFAIGGDDALPGLKDVMDRVADGPPDAERDPSAPFRLTAHVSSWLALAGEEDAPNVGRELAREAFAEGGDTIQVEVRPTDTGARLRIQLDEGFVRFLGLSMARQVDRRR